MARPCVRPVAPVGEPADGADELAADGALSVAGACRLAGVKRGTLSKLIAAGEIPVFRVGSLVIVPRRGVTRWIARKLRESGAS